MSKLTSGLLFTLLNFALIATANAQTTVVTLPPPGSQTPISSAAVEGFVIDPSESIDRVFFRTRYANGSICPPVIEDGGYEPNQLGWAYDITWDGSGLGTFQGRIKWLAAGTNFIDIYLPGGTLGSPNYTQSIIYQPASVQPTDVVANIHPLQRTIDTVPVGGGVGELGFRIDLLNTTLATTMNIDLSATCEMPDGTVVNLPMGGMGAPSKSYSLIPGDFSFTSVVNQAGMTFSFPLDQAPFPQPIQEGAYHVELFVHSGPSLIFFDENTDFEITNRTGRAFRDVTDAAGLGGVDFQGGNLPAAGTCVAVFDYNRDGLPDMFFSNPAADTTFLAIGANWPYPGGRNYLLQNNGDGTFSDVTVIAGVAGDMAKASYGVSWGDVDSDGDLDLFVANRERHPYFYRNNNDGTFTDVAQSALGSLQNNSWWMAPRFGDVDADGDLDLYVGKYMETFSSTWQLGGWENSMFRNEFQEGLMDPMNPSFPLFTHLVGTATESNGVTLGSFFMDSNRDGDLDLFVQNDFGAFSIPNEIFEGDGSFGFTEVGAARGADVREFSMGAATADFDGDGALDLYSTSIGRNSLLFGDGVGNYTQGAMGSGAEATYLTLGPQADGLNLNDNWGAVAWDYDLDMNPDLYVVGADLFTGYNIPIAEIHPDSVFRNNGFGQFTEEAGNLGLDNGGRGRGAATIDYDGDGDQDIIVVCENEGPTLQRNDQVLSNHWVGVRPQTTRSAPGGFNTYFEVTAGGKTQVFELMAEVAHAGQGDNYHVFGLGSNTTAEITAYWQRGGSTTLFNQAADTEKLIYETVIEVEGQIDGSIQEGNSPSVRLHGPPLSLAIAVLGDPTIPVNFPLPSGGSLDLWPNFSFLNISLLNGIGAGVWPLPAVPIGFAGFSFEFQMVTFDTQGSVYDSKSGVSSLTVTP
jgi:hypothetical protein